MLHKCILAITRSENDISVALLCLGLQPTGCLSLTTEVDDSSSLNNLIRAYLNDDTFLCHRVGLGREVTLKHPYTLCTLSLYESGSQLLVLSFLHSNCSGIGEAWSHWPRKSHTTQVKTYTKHKFYPAESGTDSWVGLGTDSRNAVVLTMYIENMP